MPDRRVRGEARPSKKEICAETHRAITRRFATSRTDHHTFAATATWAAD
ncbi:hypothetical protein V3G39_03035 [Dermatophilaceae bacterium Sec6.4]